MPYTVTTVESPQLLNAIIGNTIVANLDNQQLEDQIADDDTVISGGGLYTLIVGIISAEFTVLAKGVYYTIIEETA